MQRKRKMNNEDNDKEESEEELPEKMERWNDFKLDVQRAFLADFRVNPELSYANVRTLAAKHKMKNFHMPSLYNKLFTYTEEHPELVEKHEKDKKVRNVEAQARRILNLKALKTLSRETHSKLENIYKNEQFNPKKVSEKLILKESTVNKWLKAREQAEKKYLIDFEKFLSDPGFSSSSNRKTRKPYSKLARAILEEAYKNGEDFKKIMTVLILKTKETEERIINWLTKRRYRDRKAGISLPTPKPDTTLQHSSTRLSSRSARASHRQAMKVNQRDKLVAEMIDLPVVVDRNLDHDSDIEEGNNSNGDDMANWNYPQGVRIRKVIIQGSRDDHVSTDFSSPPLTVQEICSIRKGEMVDVEWIDVMTMRSVERYLRNKATSVWILSVRSFEQLILDISLRSIVNNRNGNSRAFLAESIGEKCNNARGRQANIFKKDYVVVPICESDHCALAVILHPMGVFDGDNSERKCRILFFDSNAFNPDGSETRSYLREGVHLVLTEYLRSMYIKYEGDFQEPVQFVPERIQTLTVTNAPQQEYNSNDCALFTIHYIRAVLASIDSGRVQTWTREDVDWREMIPEEHRNIGSNLRFSVLRTIMSRAGPEERELINRCRLGFPELLIDHPQAAADIPLPPPLPTLPPSSAGKQDSTESLEKEDDCEEMHVGIGTTVEGSLDNESADESHGPPIFEDSDNVSEDSYQGKDEGEEYEYAGPDDEELPTILSTIPNFSNKVENLSVLEEAKSKVPNGLGEKKLVGSETRVDGNPLNKSNGGNQDQPINEVNDKSDSEESIEGEDEYEIIEECTELDMEELFTNGAVRANHETFKSSNDRMQIDVVEEEPMTQQQIDERELYEIALEDPSPEDVKRREKEALEKKQSEKLEEDRLAQERADKELDENYERVMKALKNAAIVNRVEPVVPKPNPSLNQTPPPASSNVASSTLTDNVRIPGIGKNPENCDRDLFWFNLEEPNDFQVENSVTSPDAICSKNTPRSKDFDDKPSQK